jgi:iron complex outermembrane receptor protein
VGNEYKLQAVICGGGMFLHMGSAGAGAAEMAPTAASPADPGALQEVVVTAQKRAERFQDVPVSVTVVDQAQLLDRNITDISQLSLAAPSFSSHPGSCLNSSDSSRTNSRARRRSWE